jgi:hypothetical protein
MVLSKIDSVHRFIQTAPKHSVFNPRFHLYLQHERHGKAGQEKPEKEKKL